MNRTNSHDESVIEMIRQDPEFAIESSMKKAARPVF